MTTTSLQEASVHLWIWRIDAGAPYPHGACSPEDLARSARFVRPADRAAHLAAHAGLRVILSDCLDLPPSTLAFGSMPAGKPFLATPAGSGLHFNLSHSKGLAALGVARFPIGVDVEALRPIGDELAAEVFSPLEQEEYAALEPGLRLGGFFRGWTRKEAVVKALGSGLSAPLARFSVSLSPDAPARLRDLGWAPGAAESWRIAHFSVGSGHVGAVAASRRDWRLVIAESGALSRLGLAAPVSGQVLA